MRKKTVSVLNTSRSSCGIIYSLTSNICSSVNSSYLVWNFSLSERVPLALLHDTSGFGSPVTTALKIANFPKRHVFCLIMWKILLKPKATISFTNGSVLMVSYNLKHPPFSIVTATGLHWKSGVLFPSGMFTKYCVIITPEVLDLFRIAAKQNGGGEIRNWVNHKN